MGDTILSLLDQNCFIHISRMEDDMIGLVVGRNGTISTKTISPDEIDVDVRYSADTIISGYLKEMGEELRCSAPGTKDIKPVKERFDLEDDEFEIYE